MTNFIQKNMFLVKHSKFGDVEYFITKYVCGNDNVPTVSMPFCKPNGEYGHISINKFTRIFDNKFRVIMYKTSNKYLNRLFKNNEYYDIRTKPSNNVEITINYNGETFFISLNEYEFTIKSKHKDIHPETLTYKATKKAINNVLDSMVGFIQIMTE